MEAQPASRENECEKGQTDNEISWYSKEGKLSQIPLNDNLLMLYSPVKNKYDVNNQKQAQEDIDKMLEIKSNYKKFKQVKDFA